MVHFFHACPTLSGNRSYLTSCVFVQLYHLPHHLDIVWYFFRICSLLLLRACHLLSSQTESFLSETAMNSMLKLARLLSVLRFVYPRKVFLDLTSFITTMTTLPCSVFHGAGLISVFTLLSLVQLCGR